MIDMIRTHKNVIGAVSVAILLLPCWGCDALTPSVTLRMPTDLEDFLFLAAVNLKAPELCQRINPLADGGGGGWSPAGLQVETLRSSCYYNLATSLRDAKLCNQVRAVIAGGLDGSKYDTAYCLAHLGEGEIAAVPHRMDVFVAMMRKMGYGDRQIQEFRYKQHIVANPVVDAYSELRTDKAFLALVSTGPSYAEKFSPAKVRPANGVEFLYQMAAIDTNDVSLCAKISPNATFAYLVSRGSAERTSLLRSYCHAVLAYNRLDAAPCAQLPPANESIYVHSDFDSRERCQATVAADRSRPDRKFMPNGENYGATPFPVPSYFESALHEIGYTGVYAHMKLDAPSPDDYWDFLSVGVRGNGRERVEFLHRIMSLR